MMEKIFIPKQFIFNLLLPATTEWTPKLGPERNEKRVSIKKIIGKKFLPSDHHLRFNKEKYHNFAFK